MAKRTRAPRTNRPTQVWIMPTTIPLSPQRNTMSIPSPFLGFATLGLARVHRDLAAPGTRLEARLEEGAYEAEIVSTPVYDPERARVRS